MLKKVEITYKRPVAKTAEICHFFLVAICNSQMARIGKISMHRSDKTFHTPVVMKTELISTQVPSSVGFQIFSLGLHSNMTTKNMAA